MKKMTFNESLHQYSVDGLILPSVTKIMEPLTKEMYSHIDAEVLQTAAKRGTSVHYATELYDLYGVEEIEEENRGYFEAYKRFKKENNVLLVEVEIQLYHPYLFYAGTIDRIVKIGDKMVLLDIKTTDKLHKKLVEIQVSAYKEMAEKQGYKIDEIAALKLNKDGTYVFNYLDNNLDMFMNLYKLHMFKKKYIH